MEKTEQRAPFASWSILELMGHRRLAGYVQEVELAGQGLLRIDIPSEPPVTQFYGVASVYCLTPTTEEVARAVAAQMSPQPVHPWELPKHPELPGPFVDEDAGDEDEDEIRICDTCDKDVTSGGVDTADGRFLCDECAAKEATPLP
jgi:hypothetical protein